MKTLTSLLLIFFVATFSSMAQTSLPNSYVNVGFGVGRNYGLLGVKTVVGYRNSGLLLGLGHLPGIGTGVEIGAQLSLKSVYINFTHGTKGYYSVNDGPIERIRSSNFMIGGMVSLDKRKTIFIDFALGHSIGAPDISFGPFTESQESVTASLGIGFRLGQKTSAD